MASEVTREKELAENEPMEILASALYAALEAELSSRGWPTVRVVGVRAGSRACLETTFEALDILISTAEGN